MRAEHEERVALAADIREAVRGGQIVPFFYSKRSIFTGTIIGVEAVARWQHPKKGLLSPQHFGAMFADHDIAAAIGQSMMNEVAKHVRQWLDEGHSPGRMALNLSSAQFNQPGLATEILEALDHWRVPPEH